MKFQDEKAIIINIPKHGDVFNYLLMQDNEVCIYGA